MSLLDIEIPNPGCVHCTDPLDFDFTFAFQPIVDIEQKKIFAHEALVRGKEGQSSRMGFIPCKREKYVIDLIKSVG